MPVAFYAAWLPRSFTLNAFAPAGCHPERSAAESKDPVEIRLIMPRDVSTSLDMTCGRYAAIGLRSVGKHYCGFAAGFFFLLP